MTVDSSQPSTHPTTEQRRRLLGFVQADAPAPKVERKGEPYGVHRGDALWFLQNIPCLSECPAYTDVPRYVAHIARSEWDRAFEVNRETNLFPSVLCRICHRPCEDVCRRGLIDAPVAVRALKKAAAGHAAGNGAAPDLSKAVAEAGAAPKKVAIVGSGPAGMAAALDLRSLGHQVVVYESAPVPGGMMAFGIPPFRLSKEVVQQEVRRLEELGIEIRCDSYVGRDVSLPELESEYDAALLAAGCQKPVHLNLPGEDLEGVYSALDFMRHACLGDPLPVGRSVAVIGAGCAGLDCTRTALRLGAESVVAFDLVGRHEIDYDIRDLEEAEAEDVVVHFRTVPTRFVGENGHVTAIDLVRMETFGEPDARGRRQHRPVPGSEFTLPADAVVIAVSQGPDLSWLSGIVDVEDMPRGRLAVDPETHRLGDSQFFAAGDLVSGPRYVSEAIADGRRAAATIARFLAGDGAEPPTIRAGFTLVPEEAPASGYHLDQEDRLNEWAQSLPPVPAPSALFLNGGRPMAPWTAETIRRRIFGADDYDRVELAPAPWAAKEARPPMDREVELTYSEEAAAREAQRCLQCQLNLFVDPEGCTLCGTCVDVCPYRCLSLVSADRIASVDGEAQSADLERARGWRDGAALVIDEEQCIRCGICVTRCPTRCLTMHQFEPVKA